MLFRSEVAREVKTLAHLENIARRRADAGQLRDYLRAVPGAEYGRRLVLAGARALVELEAMEAAQKLIEGALDGHSEAGWQPALVALYGAMAGPGLTGRIAKAENWLRQYPGEAALLLALGRMCMNQRLWGKAQSYIEASLATEETRDAHLALAELCDQLERSDEALGHKDDNERGQYRPLVTTYDLSLLNIETRHPVDKIINARRNKGADTLCFFGFLNIFCALRFDQSGFFSILLRLSLLVGGLSD